MACNYTMQQHYVLDVDVDVDVGVDVDVDEVTQLLILNKLLTSGSRMKLPVMQQ